MRQRPTAALLELDDPFTGWTPHDYRLQEAMITLNKEKCKTCGNPIWLCHSADNRIEFEVKTQTCYAQAEILDYEDDKSNPPLEHGEYHIARAVGLENEEGGRDPLPSRSEAFAKV